MIFELRNKVPHDSSFLKSEDVLTSTIFGNLRYFKNQNLLISFLNKAIDYNGVNLNINTRNIFKIDFWKKYYLNNSQKYNEPDLYLNNNKYNVIIECKYHSFLDEKTIVSKDNRIEYSNQLIRYSKIIEKSKKKKIIIYLTNEVGMPIKIIEETLKRINKNIKLFWLSWRMLHKAMDNHQNDNYSYGERQVFNDLLLFLKKRELTIFCGLRIKTVEFYWEYSKYYKTNSTKVLRDCKRYKYSPRGFLNFN
jgi:hypothetical protein